MEIFKFNNPHPKGKIVGDCVKRAITLTTGKDYMEVQRELNKTKKLTGCEVYNQNRNYKYYLEKTLGCKKLSFPAVKGQGRINGAIFAIDHPTGRYVLRMAGHLSCCIDGQINDTWDCSDKCVYTAWKVEVK